MNASFQKWVIILTLSLFLSLAFFIRWQNFNNMHSKTIDESVYQQMALQIDQAGLIGYTAWLFARDFEKERGQKLPYYFYQPIFKHPPLFTLLLVVALNIFGFSMTSFGAVSALFGVGMIALTYALGKLLFNRVIGLWSAIFVWLDPINIVTSQKSWMETTLAFFSMAMIYFYLLAIKRNKNIYFLLSGFLGSLALLTKYPGILPTIIVLIHAAFYQRQLFSNKRFILSISLPFIMIIPWLIWNIKVFGFQFFTQQAQMHNLFLTKPRTSLLAIFFVFCIWLVFKYAKRVANFSQSFQLNMRWSIVQNVLVICFLCIIGSGVVKGLYMFHTPYSAWERTWSGFSDVLFYFKRLPEFSFIYTLGFLGLFYHNWIKEKESKQLIFITVFILFLFYIIWGSFQSRYILTATPFLIILGVKFSEVIFERINMYPNDTVRFLSRCVSFVFVIYILIRACYLNFTFSFPHSFCYF